MRSANETLRLKRIDNKGMAERLRIDRQKRDMKGNKKKIEKENYIT